MKLCSVEGCNGKHKGHGYCYKHYERFRRYGDPLKGGAFRIKNPERCTVDCCERKPIARGFCHLHYQRNATHGDPNKTKNIYGRYADWTKMPNGYVLKWVGKGKPNTRNGYLYQHRHVMSQHIGRPLLEKESVHHVNGDRTDNRIENLELWSRGQPAGQRIDDKVRDAVRLIERYAKDHTVLSTDTIQSLKNLSIILGD